MFANSAVLLFGTLRSKAVCSNNFNMHISKAQIHGKLVKGKVLQIATIKLMYIFNQKPLPEENNVGILDAGKKKTIFVLAKLNIQHQP